MTDQAEQEPTKEAIAHGTKVTVIAQAVTQVVRVLTNIVLARMLTPDDFGIVAIATIVIALMEQLKDLGTGSAIIQARTLSHDLINAVFYLNAALGLLLALSLTVAAHPLAVVLGDAKATDILIALSLTTLLSSFGQIHHALLRRHLNYRAVAVTAAVVAVLTAAVSTALALAGLGVWSLVIGTIAGSVVGTWMVWRYDPWRPTRPRRLSVVKEVWGYSIHLFFTNLVTYALNQGTNVIIGRGLGARPLGQFSYAQRTIFNPVSSVTVVAIEVLFPAFSRMQDDDAAIREGYVRSSRAIALVTFPAMAGMIAVATPFVYVVLGPQWHALVPLIWILAPVGAIQSVSTTYSELLMAKGRTDVNFRIGLVIGVLALVAELIGLHWGLIGATIGLAIVAGVGTPCGLFVAFAFIGQSPLRYAAALAPTAIASVVMMLAAWTVAHALGTGITALLGGVFIGAVVYAAIILVLRFPAAIDVRTVLLAKRA